MHKHSGEQWWNLKCSLAKYMDLKLGERNLVCSSAVCCVRDGEAIDTNTKGYEDD